MKSKSKGIALLEYFLIGAVVVVGSATLLKPYSDEVAKAIKHSAGTRNTQTYAAPPVADPLPNTGVTPPAAPPPGTAPPPPPPVGTIAPPPVPVGTGTVPPVGSGSVPPPGSGSVPPPGSGSVPPPGSGSVPPPAPVTDPCVDLTLANLAGNIDAAQLALILADASITDAQLKQTKKLKSNHRNYTVPRYIVATSTADGKTYLYQQNDFDSRISKGRVGYHIVKWSELGMGTGADEEFIQTGDPSDPDEIVNFNASRPYCPAGTYFSTPLILDMNGDGKVSSKDGMGVDIDGNGTPDGAAVYGDKMLAMSDQDGDKKITGKEVFGDRTVDPFTGKSINAANGFLALKEIALSAEKFTGIKCLEGTYVDVRKLDAAMKKLNKGKLGLISGNNVTLLEPLGKVSKINIAYGEVSSHSEDTENIKHKQISNWLDIKNISHAIHDVWFALTKAVKNVASNLLKTFINL